MNILLVSYIFYPEPIAMSTIVEDMASELSKEHDVTVLTSKPCRPIGYELSKETVKPEWNFKRIILESDIYPQTGFIGRAKESNSFGKYVANYLKKTGERFDVVYGCIPPLFGQKIIIKCCKKLGIPCVIHVEDIYPEPFLTRLPGVLGKIMFKMFLPMDKYILNNAAKVIAIGPKLREYLINTRKINPAKVEYVYNWQDDKRFSIDSNENEINKDFTFMYVGSLSVAANLLNIAKCYVKANPKGSRLVFAGSGALKEALQQIAQENPLTKIDFWDAKSTDVPLIQSKADVLVLPLRPGVALKAFPSKFPAYLYSKKPILAFVEENSDVADCIENAGCGWVVDPLDEAGLMAKFVEIASEKRDVLLKMGLNGNIYGRKNLTKEVNLAKICSIITKAAKKKMCHESFDF